MGLPKEISDFMVRYGVTSDEIWKIPQGNAFAIKHKALERVASNIGVKYEPPQIVHCDLTNKTVAIVVSATLGERTEWATGEASPYNNKNGYPLAMAEKRAKDRCILKLLQSHGALYSETEADEFTPRKNPHVTEPKDIVPEVEYDEQGQPVDNIPLGDAGIERLPKAKSRQDFEAAQKEMQSTVTLKQLGEWGVRNANRIESYPADWAAIMRGLYSEHRDSLRNGKAA